MIEATIPVPNISRARLSSHQIKDYKFLQSGPYTVGRALTSVVRFCQKSSILPSGSTVDSGGSLPSPVQFYSRSTGDSKTYYWRRATQERVRGKIKKRRGEQRGVSAAARVAMREKEKQLQDGHNLKQQI
ncbi:hypothetical protein M9H77_04537 [Catharanthus roseus]|uniref:Uncharacterized protein n=1 Tax=Catharanthus roseus TaxID=4058 RepID=A0ACC0CEU8_CATRO|nr:hypothetical protein M9H77_04537 [Catharanthus roseus]